MKHFLTLAILVSLLVSCNKNKSAIPDAASEKKQTVNKDKQEIEKLVWDMY